MTLCVALARIDPHEGDVIANLARIRRARADAAALGSDLAVTPTGLVA